MSQTENEKVYYLGDNVAVRSETTGKWFMSLISEVNDPSKEVKVRFMRNRGSTSCKVKLWEKWFPKSAIFHRCSVPSIDNRMRNSFDAIDIESKCDKMKTYTR